MKLVKVMDGLASNASGFVYKLGEVNVSEYWNPNSDNPKDFGGFNYATEDIILRWLHRGTYIYDVEIPNDAEVKEVESATIVYRTNKIIISNPRKIDDDMALYFYEISKIPEKAYYKALAAVTIKGYSKTANRILKDKINKDNIDLVLEEWNDFIYHKDQNDRNTFTGLIKEIYNKLLDIKNSKCNYYKWVFGTSIANKDNENFDIGKVAESDIWDPENPDWDKKGGFNFTNSKSLIRWMSRGDILYEVELPKDAEIYSITNMKTPGGIIIANKIILKNPINISNELLEYYYEISDLPLNTYFELIGLLASRGYYELANRIIKDKVNQNNKIDALKEFNDSIKPWHKVNYDCYNKVKKELENL